MASLSVFLRICYDFRFYCSIDFQENQENRVTCFACQPHIIVAIGIFRIGGQVRMYGFHRLAERSVPLVQAIRGFENEKGHPPNSLKDLIPEYLHSIPDTGMGAYPNYKYIVGEESRKCWDNNPWVLYIDTSSGGLNWDMFMYFPNQNYPKRGYGGALEQIGYWAYVHE